jgi:hypothetical protein
MDAQYQTANVAKAVNETRKDTLYMREFLVRKLNQTRRFILENLIIAIQGVHPLKSAAHTTEGIGS